MRNSRKLQFLFTVCMGILYVAVSCKPLVTPAPILSVPTVQNQVVQPAATLAPPSLTPEPTHLPTIEISAKPTEILIEEVLISPLGKANCRSLPFGTSKIIGYLRTGQIVKANGMDVGGDWISIENPDKKDGSSCWVSKTTVKTSGDLTTLPYISAVQK